jgi:hypothetical protein
MLGRRGLLGRFGMALVPAWIRLPSESWLAFISREVVTPLLQECTVAMVPEIGHF